MPAIETYRAVVMPADCDALGHMNVAQYFSACSQGVFAIQTALGLPPGQLREPGGRSFVVMHAESDFRAETLAGDVIYLMTEIEHIGGATVTFKHRLYSAEAPDKPVFEAAFDCVLMDLDTRKAVGIPKDIRTAAAAYLSSSG